MPIAIGIKVALKESDWTVREQSMQELQKTYVYSHSTFVSWSWGFCAVGMPIAIGMNSHHYYVVLSA